MKTTSHLVHICFYPDGIVLSPQAYARFRSFAHLVRDELEHLGPLFEQPVFIFIEATEVPGEILRLSVNLGFYYRHIDIFIGCWCYQ